MAETEEIHDKKGAPWGALFHAKSFEKEAEINGFFILTA